MKIMTIVGARPQFIKAAALSRELKKRSTIQEIIVHTGQHFDKNMSGVFFDEMDIPKPTYNLAINSLGHGAMTGRMLEEIEKLLVSEKPNMLLVYGDTNSTLAGALAAKKTHIKVGHVEAGLRSFNMQMPEEVNRILTDRISDFLFCPTSTAVENLKKEGFDHFDCQIHQTGDVMQDAAMYYSTMSAQRSKVLSDLGNPSNYVLATIHRAENTDSPENLKSIVDALNEINHKTMVVCPLHPRTRKIIDASGIDVQFRVINPVGYFDMIELLKGSSLVTTDSGGLQKEAFFFQKPCITLREQTEWVELVQNGYNIIAGTDQEKILDAFEKLISNHSIDFSMNLYGQGEASKNIADILVKSL
jgi:UDP-GlcNAc3NAcA epimerase